MTVALTLQSLTLGGIVCLLAMGLNQHKIWVRLKDRMNTLWFHHCATRKEPYVPLENGK